MHVAEAVFESSGLGEAAEAGGFVWTPPGAVWQDAQCCCAASTGNCTLPLVNAISYIFKALQACAEGKHQPGSQPDRSVWFMRMVSCSRGQARHMHRAQPAAQCRNGVPSQSAGLHRLAPQLSIWMGQEHMHACFKHP